MLRSFTLCAALAVLTACGDDPEPAEAPVEVVEPAPAAVEAPEPEEGPTTVNGTTPDEDEVRGMSPPTED